MNTNRLTRPGLFPWLFYNSEKNLTKNSGTQQCIQIRLAAYSRSGRDEERGKVQRERQHFIECKIYYHSLLLNGFGDHFIQDAFAGGHLPVKRNSSGLDNNGIHDFLLQSWNWSGEWTETKNGRRMETISMTRQLSIMQRAANLESSTTCGPYFCAKRNL